MVQYRRAYQPGGRFFFTAVLQDRSSALLTEHIAILRDAWQQVTAARPFETVAVCVLPDHLHTIWALPEGDSDYAGRWRAIKAKFTRGLRLAGVAIVANPSGGYGIWQRRYWEHTIRDEDDLRVHVDYIHFNPMKHGWAACVADWPHSSFHRYVREGLLPVDWGGSLPLNRARGFGE